MTGIFISLLASHCWLHQSTTKWRSTFSQFRVWKSSSFEQKTCISCKFERKRFSTFPPKPATPPLQKNPCWSHFAVFKNISWCYVPCYGVDERVALRECTSAWLFLWGVEELTRSGVRAHELPSQKCALCPQISLWGKQTQDNWERTRRLSRRLIHCITQDWRLGRVCLSVSPCVCFWVWSFERLILFSLLFVVSSFVTFHRLSIVLLTARCFMILTSTKTAPVFRERRHIYDVHTMSYMCCPLAL